MGVPKWTFLAPGNILPLLDLHHAEGSYRAICVLERSMVITRTF